MDIFELYKGFAEIFEENGFYLYIGGGSARDILLGRTPNDLDLVTNATPEEEKKFLNGWYYSFSKFGIISKKIEGIEVDIATMRKEEGYEDFRHPNKVTFITSLEEDSKRRDFTINALYIDKNKKVYDFHNGKEDLKKKLIRFIGDPATRIKEDPLRIIRAERFAKKLGFEIEENTKNAINKYRYLLDRLNTAKVEMELRKNYE